MRKYNEQEKELVTKMIGLGINLSSKGFNYMLDAAKIIHDTDDNVKITYLYNKVAHINNASYHNVERDIRREIDRLYDTCPEMPSILVADPSRGKLTNGEFLYRLAYWLYK